MMRLEDWGLGLVLSSLENASICILSNAAVEHKSPFSISLHSVSMLAIYCIGARRLHEGFSSCALRSFVTAWCTVGRFDELGSKEEEGRELKHKLNMTIICLFKEGFAVSYSILLNE